MLVAAMVLLVGGVAAACGGDDDDAAPAPAEPAPEPAPDPPAEGDVVAGEDLYARAGCGSCHTLADAGTTGNIGPNLDDSTSSFELAVERMTNGSGAMPSFLQQLGEDGINDVAAYIVSVTS
jgi:mono/diheme cytochrome c family protein